MVLALAFIAFIVWARHAPSTSASSPLVQVPQATLSFTVDSADGKLLTYYLATDSNLYQFVWPWDPNQWSQITGTHGRPAVDENSGIASYVNPISHSPEIFYLAKGSQHVQHISILGLLPTDLNSATGAPPALPGSSLAGFIDECAQSDNLFYVGVDQHLHLLTWALAQGWTTQDLTSLTHAASVAGTRIAGHIHGKAAEAFYFGSDHHLHELWRWSGCFGSPQFDGWHPVDVNRSSNRAAVDVAEASPLSGFWEESRNEDADLFVDSHHHLQELLYSNSAWTSTDVTKVSASPMIATSAIAAHHNPTTNSEYIYFLDSNRNIRALTAPAASPTQWKEEFKTPLNVLAGRCSGATPAPAPAAAARSPLVAGVNSILDGAEEVFYVGENQQLYQLEFNRNGWSCANITKSSGAPDPAQ